MVNLNPSTCSTKIWKKSETIRVNGNRGKIIMIEDTGGIRRNLITKYERLTMEDIGTSIQHFIGQ